MTGHTVEQLSLDDVPRVRLSDPTTSRLAAAQQTPERLSAGRRLALAGLARGACTDFELAERTGHAQTSIRCRRKDLVRLGYATDTGVTRPSPTGSAAKVWELTDAGRDLHARLLAGGHLPPLRGLS